MELLNDTRFPAGIFRTVIDEERIAASVLARVTYDWVDGLLTPSTEQAWGVSAPPWESPYGAMDSDEVFYKGGVDLFIFGQAYAPAEQETTQVEVTLEVGPFQRRAIVFGDRVWERRDNSLVPSAPKPFKTIPLTMAHSFGGKDQWDGLDVPFMDNPDGKGFYLEEESALGHALPNIENAEALISRWDDRPEPVGFTTCPIHCMLRVRNGIELDEDGQLRKLRPVLFNAAYPRMIVEQLSPGDTVRLGGLTAFGPFAFRIPQTELYTRLQFDNEKIERPLAIDQVGIEVEKQRVFVAYRYPFRYIIYPLQKRSCELFIKAAPTLEPGGLPS